jgi:hypothetical protein
MPGMIQPQRELEWSPEGRLMRVSVRCIIDGRWNSMSCEPSDPRAITRAQWDAWQAGRDLQTAIPQLSANEREFLISGITSETWERMFGDHTRED